MLAVHAVAEGQGECTEAGLVRRCCWPAGITTADAAKATGISHAALCGYLGARADPAAACACASSDLLILN